MTVDQPPDTGDTRMIGGEISKEAYKQLKFIKGATGARSVGATLEVLIANAHSDLLKQFSDGCSDG